MKVFCLLLAIAWMAVWIIWPKPESLVISQMFCVAHIILNAIDKAARAIQKGAE